MKKTDLVKSLARKVDGKMKTAGFPERFGQGATPAAFKRERPPEAAAGKRVAISCRLPADLVQRLRARAAVHDGGLNRLVAEALEHWFATAPATEVGSNPAADRPANGTA